MKELSLNILDIAMNSVKAEAKTVRITLTETDETFCFTISDDGRGMSRELLSRVTDPFCTTRTTRPVGMGIPLLKLAAEQTGGGISITSVSRDDDSSNCGTSLNARFYKNTVDFTPLGDIISTVITLIQGSPDIRWIYTHTFPSGEVTLDTDELKTELGDVPLDTPDVLVWIREYLKEGYSEYNSGL